MAYRRCEDADPRLAPVTDSGKPTALMNER